MRNLPVLCAAALLGSLSAQSIVVPNANATARGTSQLNSIVRNAGNPRTYQWGANASELAGIPLGSVITGVSLRFMVFATNAASWPPADIQWNNYDIYAGPASPIASWVADPNANFASPPQLVRSGPMVLDAGSFTNTSPTAPTPNAWSEFYFDFQTPYLYLGGDLALLFSHPGSTDAATAQYPETVVSSATTYGAGRTQSVYPAGTASTATTFYVMRIHYGYGMGCPGTNNLTPVLVQSGNTTGGLGGTMNLQLANAPANGVGVLVFGLGSASIPTPNGCTLLTNPLSTTLVLTNGKGRAPYAFVVPPAVQAAFQVQAAMLDAGAIGGYTLTNGVSPDVQ